MEGRVDSSPSVPAEARSERYDDCLAIMSREMVAEVVDSVCPALPPDAIAAAQEVGRRRLAAGGSVCDSRVSCLERTCGIAEPRTSGYQRSRKTRRRESTITRIDAVQPQHQRNVCVQVQGEAMNKWHAN